MGKVGEGLLRSMTVAAADMWAAAAAAAAAGATTGRQLPPGVGHCRHSKGNTGRQKHRPRRTCPR